MDEAISFDEYTIQTNQSLIGLSTQGGYVTSWRIKNSHTGQFEDILYQGKTIKRSGIPILFPQFSEAYGIRKHGFGRDSVWRVINQNTTSIKMELTDKDISRDAKKEYPYQFTVHISVELIPLGIVYTLSVINPGKSDLPISPGLHPYWAINHSDKQKITIDGILEFDATAIDWNTSPPDIGYAYRGKTIIHMPQNDITIEDVTPGNPVIHHIVVWSQTPKQDDYHYVCVEPVCGYIHALDTGPILVQSGKEWDMKLRFSARPT